MRKRMQEVEVQVQDNGEIFIVQPQHGHDDAIVSISHDQVPTLVEWLREAQEIAAKQNTPGKA